MTGRTSPLRTCVGCRLRTSRSDLLRAVVAEVDGVLCVVPDPRGRLPGRGAWLHPDTRCLDLAVRRRAFARALRSPGGPDPTPLRRYLEVRAQAAAGDAAGAARPPVHDTSHDGSGSRSMSAR